MPNSVIKFDDFELDPVRYELRRKGRALKIEKIPMDLLILLAGSDGRLVTREEMEAQLWGKEVFVDAEHGINTAVRKIRQVLGDDPDEPRFVQTVQRKGYRFIAAATPAEQAQSLNASPAVTVTAAPVLPSEAHAVADSSPHVEELQTGTKPPRSSNLHLAWYTLAAALLLAWPTIKFLQNRLERPPARSIAIQSIAVLPLENISGDPEQDYFADGMTDELITMLAKYRSLRVISRTSVMQYEKVHRPLPEIARELGVDGIIEGTVSRSQDRVRVRAQLLYAPTDTHLWAESYERGLGDILSLQQELARSIAEHVKAASSSAETSASSVHAPANPAARDAYFRGRYYWTSGRYQESGQFFEEAIRLDPNYGAAYAGLADSYTASAVSGEARPLEALPKGETAAKKALQLDDAQSEGHHSMAAVQFFYHWNWEAADKEIRRALELNPNSSEGHHLHAYILEVGNHPEESIQEDKRATELDPFGRSWAYGYSLYRARRFDEALKEFQQRAEVQPDLAILHAFLYLSYTRLGDSENAFTEAKKVCRLNGDQTGVAAREQAYLRGGLQAVHEVGLQQLKEMNKQQYISPYKLAEHAATAGHRDEAIAYLEQAFRQHDPMLVRLQHYPEFDFLHSDSRYVAILRKIGLPSLP